MPHIAKAKRIIREQMAAHEMSAPELAQLIGVSHTTVTRLLKATGEDVRFATLQAIAGVFGLTISQLIGETPIDPDPKVRIVQIAMQQMPEYLKDAVVSLTTTLAADGHTPPSPTSHDPKKGTYA